MKTEHMLLIGGGVIVLAVVAYVIMMEKKLQKPGDPPARWPFNLLIGEPPAAEANYGGYY